MPFKSEAQRKLFQAKLARGEISQKTYDEWDKATGNKKLPERIGPQRDPKGPLKASLGELVRDSYTKRRFS